MKRLIIYDLDGTLVDTRDDLAQAVEHTLKTLQAPIPPREEILGAVGRGLRQLFATVLQTDEAMRLESAIQVFMPYYATHLVDHSRLYPGVEELLAYCDGRTQAVVTNKPNPFARDLLAALGVAHRFADIIGGDDGFPKKPDPAAVRTLMAGARAAPADTLLIGDSAIDVETGRNAGVDTVVVAHGFSPAAEVSQARPTTLVSGFPELQVLLRQRGW